MAQTMTAETATGISRANSLAPSESISESCPTSSRPFVINFLRLWVISTALATLLFSSPELSKGDWDSLVHSFLVSAALFGWCLGIHLVPAGFIMPGRKGATVRVHGDTVELFRGKEFIGDYRLSQCSWYIATARHDTALVNAWALVIPCPRTVIIEFPDYEDWAFGHRYCTERAAVGWTPATFNQWKTFLARSQVPMGRNKSVDLETVS